MSKLCWTTTKHLAFDGLSIPCADELDVRFVGDAGYKQVAGIRPSPPSQRRLKALAWPLSNFLSDILGNGFTRRTVGGWLRELADEKTVFLEIGCGPLSLRPYLRHDLWYNGMDIAFSEFQLGRAPRRPDRINLVMASATHIPLPDNSVTITGACEVFPHITEIDRAMDELGRVLVPGGRLLCSIANTCCYKYAKKGKHLDSVNEWTFEGFKTLMARHGFRCLRAVMKGWWIPLPSWLTHGSFQLPMSSRDEFYNTNFMYMFEIQK